MESLALRSVYLFLFHMLCLMEISIPFPSKSTATYRAARNVGSSTTMLFATVGSCCGLRLPIVKVKVPLSLLELEEERKVETGRQ